jgi:hypothetical protein
LQALNRSDSPPAVQVAEAILLSPLHAYSPSPPSPFSGLMQMSVYPIVTSDREHYPQKAKIETIILKILFHLTTS